MLFNLFISAGYLTVDGLEKIKRPMCAAPKDRVVAGTTRETRVLNVIQCCPNTPTLGGRYQQPSRYCSAHALLEESERRVSDPVLLPEHSLLQLKSDLVLPDDDDSYLVGYKKKQNVDRFYDRTAGIIAAVRPCGIIVNFMEMFTCESPTQVYVFVYTTFGRCLEDLRRLRYLGYDRACDFHPFLKNLAKKGSIGANILLDNMGMMVDLFHCKKHTASGCMPLDNPDCTYHPHLPKFAEVHGVNTECAEQALSGLAASLTKLSKMTSMTLHLSVESNRCTQQVSRKKKPSALTYVPVTSLHSIVSVCSCNNLTILHDRRYFLSPRCRR